MGGREILSGAPHLGLRGATLVRKDPLSSIAARLGDHHLCPEHLGAEVLPACASTIIIAGFPAARVGDSLMCHRSEDLARDAPALIASLLPWGDPIPEAPLDIIKTGEPTVLFEGQAAARVGDPTVHGGFLDKGCPTVIIGATIAEAKRLRLMERVRLIDAARVKAAGMPGRGRSRLLAAADRLARNNKAVEYARLCDAVYDGSRSPEGWQRVTGDNQAPFVDPSTGFYSALFRSEIDGSYVLAFRGTEPSLMHPQDFVYGNVQNLGRISPQYTQAVLLSQRLHELYGDNLTFTGHSLGGGLASVAALATGRPAVTINAAGVHTNTALLYSLDLDDADRLVDAYQVEDELLTGIQEGSAVGMLAPNALGTKYKLPAVNEDGSPRSKPSILSAPWTRASEAFERHGRVYAIHGMEAQKSEDVATIQGML